MVDNVALKGEDESTRPQFGNRCLQDEDNVFKHNAWDNVEWSEVQEHEAKVVVEKQFEMKLKTEDSDKYLTKCNTYWDAFYDKHDNKFFKDRHWLFTEFPELSENSKTVETSERFNILEVGCGVGNTIFPLLTTHKNENVKIYGCDFSKTAVDILKSNDLYNEEKCQPFVHDISSNEPYPIADNSLNIIVMIFVLSALKKSDMQSAIERLCKLLKPGGTILFRDYGRHDMAQLRFKAHRCIDKNFYSRGDGTLVYFFTQDEIKEMFSSAGLVERQNLVDRRLQVNRSRQIKMYRVWIQAKYQKPVVS